jgi:hypothetical protein
MIFWNEAMLFVRSYQYVGENSSLRLLGHSEYGGSRVLHQVENYLQYYTVL